jgi:hypothetical protein
MFVFNYQSHMFRPKYLVIFSELATLSTYTVNVITYVEEMSLIFWFLDFGLFPVKVQFVSKCNDGLHCYLFLDC